MHSKIYPDQSVLNRRLRIFKKRSLFENMFCIPFGYVTAMDILKKDIENVIQFYTPAFLEKIALDISREQDIFIRAFMVHVDQSNLCKDMLNDIQLIDIICAHNNKLKRMLSLQNNKYYSKDLLIKKKDYVEKMYIEYKRLGGNDNVIIYGLPEYIARIYDMRRDDIQIVYKLLARDSYLRQFVLSHFYK